MVQDAATISIHNLPPTVTSRNLASALFDAVEHGDLEDVRALLAQGGDPESRNAQGETVLMRAVTMGEPEMVELLLQHGADPNATRDDGERPLTLAAKAHAPLLMPDNGFDASARSMRLLVRYGADVARQGPRAAIDAVIWSAIETLKALDEAGLDWSAPLPEDDAMPDALPLVDRLLAMATATTVPTPDLLHFLLTRGADVHRAGEEGRTPLLMLAARNDAPVAAVAVLLEAGVELNHQDAGGRTALMYAALRRNAELFAYLLEAGADYTIRDLKGRTAIHCAAQVGALDLIEQARRAGVDLQALIHSGVSEDVDTPLQEAATGDYLCLEPMGQLLTATYRARDLEAVDRAFVAPLPSPRSKLGPFPVVRVEDPGEPGPADPSARPVDFIAQAGDFLVLALVAKVPPGEAMETGLARCAVVGCYPKDKRTEAEAAASSRPGRALLGRFVEAVTKEDGWTRRWERLEGSAEGFRERR